MINNPNKVSHKSFCLAFFKKRVGLLRATPLTSILPLISVFYKRTLALFILMRYTLFNTFRKVVELLIMETLCFILIAVTEIVFAVLTIKKYNERKIWKKNRVFLRLVEILIVLCIILLPITHLKWRFALAVWHTDAGLYNTGTQIQQITFIAML